jgi:hypothetical protein
MFFDVSLLGFVFRSDNEKKSFVVHLPCCCFVVKEDVYFDGQSCCLFVSKSMKVFCFVLPLNFRSRLKNK